MAVVLGVFSLVFLYLTILGLRQKNVVVLATAGLCLYFIFKIGSLVATMP